MCIIRPEFERLLQHAAERGGDFIFSGLTFLHDAGEIPWCDRLTMKRIAEARATHGDFLPCGTRCSIPTSVRQQATCCSGGR